MFGQPKKVFTQEQINMALDMRSRGQSWAAVVRAIGEKTEHQIRCEIEPGYREARNASARSYERRKAQEVHEEAIAASLMKPRNPAPFKRPRHSEPPSELVLAERARVYAAEQSLSRELLGDPRPGRSALDKRNVGHSEGNMAG